MHHTHDDRHTPPAPFTAALQGCLGATLAARGPSLLRKCSAKSASRPKSLAPVVPEPSSHGAPTLGVG